MSQNRYEVLGKIADGGLGSVFKAYDRNLRREVALKRVLADTPEQAERQAEQLMDEARNLSTLQHPHIVTIFDVGRDEEGAYIVMELLKGETLEHIIERGALSENDFRELVTQSLEGLVAAHSSEMIHLDIKPQNFMVIWLPSGKFQIKILDFGLAKIASQPTVQEMDEDGAIMGSIFFMAPEQFERAPLDARTDLYSLGCVYYFALTQQYPFQGETGPEVMASHLYHSFVPLAEMRPDLPPFICQWVEWLISRLPDHRPAGASMAYDIFQAGYFPAGEAAQPEHAGHAPSGAETGTITSPIAHPSAPRPARPGIHRPGATTGLVGHRPAPRPIVRPVNIAAAMAPSHLRHKKPWPKWLAVGLPAAIIGIIVIIIAAQSIASSRRTARFEALSKMENPAGTVADVHMLLNFLELQPHSESAGKLLGKLQGVEGGNALIAGHLNGMKTAWGKKHLALALAQRGIREGVDPLLAQLERTPEPDVRLAIWSAIARLGTASHHPALLDHIKGASADELRAIESALVNTARSEDNPAARGTDILNALRANSSGDDEQAMLLRALCRIGNKNALPDILNSLKSPNVKLRFAASLALGDWRNGEPVAALMEMLGSEKDTFTRLNAIASLGSLAQLSGDTPQSEIAQALITAHSATDDRRTQNQVITSLTKVTDPTAVTFLEEIAAKDPRRKSEVTAAVKALSSLLAKVVTLTDAPGTLTADQAILSPGPLTVSDGVITNWLGPDDLVSWLVKIETPGACKVQLSYSSNSPAPGRYLLSFGRENFLKSADSTGNLANFKTVSIGGAAFSKPGLYRLWIRPVEIAAGAQLMRLKEAAITPGGD